MKKYSRKSFLILSIIAISGSSCSKSETAATAEGVVAPNVVLTRVASAVNSGADSTNTGVLKGTTSNPLSRPNNANALIRQNASVDYKNLCKTDSGSAADSVTGTDFAATTVYCSLRTPSDGPDTVGGAIARVKAFVCAVADQIQYDGVERDVTMTLDTKCFTQQFVDMATSQFGKASIALKVTGYSSVPDTVAPTKFDRYFVMDFPADAGVDDFTVAYKSSDGVFGAAIKYGKPADDARDVFTALLDKTNGAVRYEGRFGVRTSGSSGDMYTRHIRSYIGGTMDSNYEFTDVQQISFIQADTYAGNSNSSQIWSMKGTPSAGRRVRNMTAPSKTPTTAQWVGSSGTGDNSCIGETGVTCTGNTGLIFDSTDYNGFLLVPSYGTFVSGSEWFKAHSYLTFTGDFTLSAE